MRRLLMPFILLAGTAAFFSRFGVAQIIPRLADPLIENERVRVEQSTLADRGVVRLLTGKRFRLLQTKLAELPKPAASTLLPPQLPRHAEVILYNYTDDVMVRALVNLQSGAVVSLEQHPSLQPSLHSDELRQAFQIALNDPQIHSILEGHEVVPEGLIVSDRTAGEPCFKNRCVELQFLVEEEPSSLVVVVNLSTETVVRVRGI